MTRPTHHVEALQYRDTPWVDDVTLWGGTRLLLKVHDLLRAPSDLAEMKGTELSCQNGTK